MRNYVPIALIAVMGAALLYVAGCETDPVATQLTITPSDVMIHDNESVTFTASGDYQYQWDLADSTAIFGLLSARTGKSVTFTSLYSGSNTMIQTLTCIATIPGTSGSSASNAEYELRAEAFIRQIK